MYIKIPFESELSFKTNISEITKMSLEHDFNVNDEVVLGNFYINGEYKSHEVSVNTDVFNFTLPFSVDYRSDIDKDSLEFNIEDFTYEIINKNTLKVNIEYSLKGEIKEDELFERVNENELESELAFIDDFIDNDYETEKEDVVVEREPIESILEEVRIVEKDDNVVQKVEEVQEQIEVHKEEPKEEVRLSEKEEKTIMETIKSSDDTFVTYHIHIMKENETIESVSMLYGTNNNYLSEYNNLDNLSVGDKILIPKIDE